MLRLTAVVVPLGLIIYLSNGNGYTNNFASGNMGQGYGALAWLTGDINGDGETDIIQPWKNSTKLGLITYLSDGNGYYCNWGTSDLGIPSDFIIFLVGDTNNDGKDDIIKIFDANGKIGIKIIYSTGSDFIV